MLQVGPEEVNQYKNQLLKVLNFVDYYAQKFQKIKTVQVPLPSRRETQGVEAKDQKLITLIENSLRLQEIPY